MTQLRRREWVPLDCEDRVQMIAASVGADARLSVDNLINSLATANRRIHEVECVNLNPANVMNPRAEALS